MSLEQQLKEHGELLKGNTDALERAIKAGVLGGGTTATETTTVETKKTKKNAAKVPDLAAVKTVASAMIKATDKQTVIKLLKKVGKVGSTSELDEKHYAAFITAATAAIKAAEAEADDDDDDEDEDDDDDEDEDDDDE